MKRPEVSVVIPTRDRPAELERALRSVLSQTGVELEAVVADDAGSDPAERVVAAIGDERARAVRRAEQGGPAAARNSAIAEARGDWVAFLDDDDEWEPRRLAAQLDAMRGSEAKWGWCSMVVSHPDGTRIEDISPSPEEMHGLLLRYCAVPGGCPSSVIASTELVRELGGFEERLPHLCDWDLWLRLDAVAAGSACAEVLATKHEHAGGIHSVDTDAAFGEFGLLRERHPGMSGRAFVRWISRSHWYAGRRLQAVRAEIGGRLRYRGR